MISILLAIYNGEKYLSECLNSVLKQSFKNFEILIGFNGTTDNSKNIVSSFKDERIKIFDYEKDKGKSKTLNKLIRHCKNDWIAIQDDDDVWNENKLLKQSQFLNKEFDVIGSQIKYINSNGDIIGGPNLQTEHEKIKLLSLTGINQVANTSTIIRKSSLIELKGWREEFDGIEDFDLWIRMLKSGKTFINLNDYLVNHRLHDKSNFNTKNFDLKKIL